MKRKTLENYYYKIMIRTELKEIILPIVE